MNTRRDPQETSTRTLLETVERWLERKCGKRLYVAPSSLRLEFPPASSGGRPSQALREVLVNAQFTPKPSFYLPSSRFYSPFRLHDALELFEP